MEADLLAATLEHDRAQVVGLDDARYPAEVFERVDVAVQEAGEGLVEEKLHVQAPRVAQDHDKGAKTALGATHGDLAEVGPVDLRRLARKGLEPREDLALARTQSPHHAAQLHGAARKAPLAEHPVQHRRA